MLFLENFKVSKSVTWESITWEGIGIRPFRIRVDDSGVIGILYG